MDTAITVDPQPGFRLSPDLYMQFMEPLGTTDGSVAAAWDHNMFSGGSRAALVSAVELRFSAATPKEQQET